MPEENQMERQLSQEDVQQLMQAVAEMQKNGFEDNEVNGNILLGYFDQNPTLPINLQTIYAFVEKDKSKFQWASAATVEYRKRYAENPGAAQALENWFQPQGILIREGDEGLINRNSLLEELKGRSISRDTILAAIGRCSYTRRPLHYVIRPSEPNPMQHKDSGSFAPKSETNLSRLDHAKRAQSASAQAPAQPVEPPDAHRFEAEKILQGGTHGFRDAAQKIVDNGRSSGQSWREIVRRLHELQHMYEGFRPAGRY
jgi:hypothetical protein